MACTSAYVPWLGQCLVVLIARRGGGVIRGMWRFGAGTFAPFPAKGGAGGGWYGAGAALPTGRPTPDASLVQAGESHMEDRRGTSVRLFDERL